jgi:purine nucleosidase
MNSKFFKTILLATITVCTWSIGISSAFATTASVGHWTLDEASGTSTADISGGLYTGTSTNTVSSTDVPSAIKFSNPGSFTFNSGNSSYVDLPGTGAVGGGSSWSICTWIKTTSTSVQEIYGEANANTGAGNNDLGIVALDMNTTVGQARLFARNSNGSASVAVTSSVVINDGNWHLICGVKNSSSDYRIYVDTIEDSSTITTVAAPALNRRAIGALKRGTVTNYMTGGLDDLRVYDRSLTKAELMDLYLGMEIDDASIQVSSATSTVIAATSTVSGDGVSATTITVSVKNASGNPISGRTVILNSSRGSNDVITPISAITDSNGVAVFTVKSMFAGVSTYTAISGDVTLSQTVAVTYSAAVINGISSINEYSNSVLSESSLRGYYRQNDLGGSGIEKDSFGSNDLSVLGTVGFGSSTLIAVGTTTSAMYNGISGRATASSSAIFDYDVSQAWTVETLVKPNITRSGATDYAIFSKMSSSTPFTGYEVQLAYGAVSNRTVVRTYLINNYAGNNYIEVLGTTDLQNNTVYHIAFTYDGSGLASGVRMYINGVLEPVTIRKDALAGSILNSASATIGARQNAKYFSGNLQEVAIYNKVITPKSIFKHYQSSLNRETDNSNPSDISQPVSVILDTDMASDIDDAADLAVLHALANNNEAKILAVITSSANEYAPAAVKAINAFYNRSTIPIGAYKGSTPSGYPSSSIFTQKLVNRFGTPGDVRANYPDATNVYREQLAQAADGSVVIVAAGFFAPLKALLQSPADNISSLTGAQLVAAKVKRLVVVAGYYPSNGTIHTADFNFISDSASASYVFDNWPTEVQSLGIDIGSTVLTAPAVSADPNLNPVKYAYDLASTTLLTNGKRPAWGQLGVLYGVRGLSTNFSAQAVNGSTVVQNGTGLTSWTQTPNSQDGFLGKIASDTSLAAILNDLLAMAPIPAVVVTPSAPSGGGGGGSVSSGGSSSGEVIINTPAIASSTQIIVPQTAVSVYTCNAKTKTCVITYVNSSAPVTSNTVTPSSILFPRDLKANSKGNDVLALQQFLNRQGFTIAKAGAGSKGKETTVFGPATKNALIRFQKYYKIYPSVGFFGPVTKAFIKTKFKVE